MLPTPHFCKCHLKKCGIPHQSTGVTDTRTAAQAKSKSERNGRWKSEGKSTAHGGLWTIRQAGRGQAPVVHREHAHAALQCFAMPTVINLVNKHIILAGALYKGDSSTSGITNYLAQHIALISQLGDLSL